MRIQNGGYLQRDYFITGEKGNFADSSIWISGIYGISFDQRYSLSGDIGSNFMKEEWGVS